MDTLSDILNDYFRDFVDRTVDVVYQSWPEKIAKAQWGPNFQQKTTTGVIVDVKLNRKTRKPMFIIFFPEIDQMVVKLHLDYVLKYCNELPEYNFLKADDILRVSAMAGVRDAIDLVAESEAEIKESVEDENTKITEDNNKPKEAPCKKKTTTKARKAATNVQASEVDEDETFQNSDIDYSDTEEPDENEDQYFPDD
jgi:hypothetical protein